jgi:hypothetical protein
MVTKANPYTCIIGRRKREKEKRRKVAHESCEGNGEHNNITYKATRYKI